MFKMKECQKREVVGAVAFGVIRKLFKVQDDNQAFNLISELLGYEKYYKKEAPETYDSIIQDLFGGEA